MRLIALAMIFLACAKAQPVAPPARAAAAPEGPRVILPDGNAILVEVAADPETRTQGLMYRDRLAPATGMLFFFPREEEHAFWMKNTRIPLDIIWIDSARRIVHIKHDVPPCRIDDCPSYPPGVPSKYVLELAGGVARRHGLKEGDVLRFEGLENVVVRE